MVDQYMAEYSFGMSLATAELPADMVSLRAFALACQSELKVAELSVQYKALEIEKLKLQIAKLRRMQFGRSSERITRQIEQLELRLEELETGEAEAAAKAEAEADTAEPVAPIRERLPPEVLRRVGGHQIAGCQRGVGSDRRGLCDRGQGAVRPCRRAGGTPARDRTAAREVLRLGQSDRGQAIGQAGTRQGIPLYDRSARSTHPLRHRRAARGGQQRR